MNLLRPILTLSVVCFISGLSLSYFYTKTRSSILKNIEKKEMKLKQEIISNAKIFKKVNLEKSFFLVEESLDEKGEVVGFLVKNKVKGYGGDIEYLLGIKYDLAEPRIINLKILSHKETPGLGAKIVSPNFLAQYVDKVASEVYLKKDSQGGKIDAITGATITSRAITNSVRGVLTNEELHKIINPKVVEQKSADFLTDGIGEKKKQVKVLTENRYENKVSTKTKTMESINSNESLGVGNNE